LLDPLARHMDRYELEIATGGFEPIRHLWLSRAARIGEQITARTGTERIAGIFETVDKDGQLVLGLPEGRRVLPAAEVYF
jgi:BirA family biotin operon repressor/biotin-[acetyl-CoA-carboxylase] ligase